MFVEASVFLIRTVFFLYITAVMLRFLLQWVRADFYNPLVQFLVTITNPPLIPLRRYIPGYRGMDLAAVLLMLVLMTVQWFLILSLTGRSIGILGLLVFSLAELLRLLFDIYFWAILIRVILSWVGPDPRQPAVVIIGQLTEPLMARARNLLPAMGGLDFSPILILIGLQLLEILLLSPLVGLAQRLS